MQDFWALLRESVLMQAFLTILLGVTICFLIVTNREIPDVLVESFLLVLGFYFGSKVSYTRRA